MNKLLVALIAGAFATVAAAQTSPPKMTKQERQQATQQATQAGSQSSVSTMTTDEMQKANVKASKDVSKMTRAEKNAMFKALQAENLTPDNSGSTANVATQQKANVAASKEVPKQKVNINTPEAQKALDKAATK